MTIRGGTRQHRQRMVAVAGAGLLLFAAGGCAGAPAPVPTSAVPTAAPVFASDEEALAAATEAYANYLEVHDSFWSDGGVAPDEYLALSTGSANEGDQKSIDTWRTNGWRGVGTTTFDSIRFRSMELTGGVQRVDIYLCLDVSKGDVVNSEGESVAKPDRPLRLPMAVQFEALAEAPSDLKIARSEVWQGENFC